ncbi:ATP-binding protein [Spirillospora sp. NPDC046719]
MPLRWRLALLFTLGAAILIGGVGLLFRQQLAAGMNSSLDDSLRARADAQVARLASSAPTPPAPSREHEGNGRAETSDTGSDNVTQVLSTSGKVLENSGDSRGPLLNGARLRDAAKGSEQFTAVIEGQRYRMLGVPARNGDRTVVVVVGASTQIVEATEARTGKIFLTAGPPAAALVGFGAYLLAGAALRPVERLRRRLADISEHDIDARLRVPGTRDEIATLATTMNAVLDRLARALARERGFVADAGHELRTPLTTLKAELELAQQPGRSRQALASAVDAAAQDTDRLIRLAEDLLLLARADEGHAFLRPRPMAPHDVLAAAVRSASARAAAHRVTLRLSGDEHLRLTADPDRLRQAVDNLLDNALRYSPPGGVIDVGLGRHGRHRRAVAVIEVRDHGPGFPPEFLPVAFERFRRADTARSRADGGTGLGLAIVRSIAHAHGGRAVADNPPGGGARVRLELPTTPAQDGPAHDE